MLQWSSNGPTPVSPSVNIEGYPSSLPAGGATSTTPVAASATAGGGSESPGPFTSVSERSTAASATGTGRLMGTGRLTEADAREADGLPPARVCDSQSVRTGVIRPLSDGSVYNEQSCVSQSSRLTTGRSVRGSCASSSPPPSSGHGTVTRQRRFTTRHVPQSAEELVHSQVLTPEMVSRFNGLMRHLKNNSEWDEQQKQVMISNMEALVPEEFEDMLQSEYARRCSFGDRMNTELMSSAKYVKMLRQCGAIISIEDVKRGVTGGLGTITLASADVIYLKVLHDCDYGSKRVSYDLFCKALYLVSRAARPDLNGEAAFSELLARIASVAPEDPTREEPPPDLMLDPNVLLVLDHFKPALHDVFHTFCNRHLQHLAEPSPGMGSIRLSEKTYWKHTQDSMNLSGMGSFGRSTMYGMNGADQSMNGDSSHRAADRSASPKAVKEEPTSSFNGGICDGDGGVVPTVAGVSPTAGAVGAMGPTEALDKKTEARNAEADAGGGYADRRPLSPSCDLVEPIYEDRIPYSGGTFDRQMGFGGCSGAGITMMSGNTMYSSANGLSQDPYTYASGHPVIKNRRRHMSINQMLQLCKELKITPDLLSRSEAVRIFKRAQCAGSHNNHGSSLYGYLSSEAFMDAAGQLALEAYSKQPFNEEYPEPHEKIHAFFMSVLPSSSREVHERFLYGCSGRGR